MLALYNTGAACYALIDKDFIKENNILIFRLKNPKSVIIYDKRIVYNALTTATYISLFWLGTVSTYYKESNIVFLVTKLSKYPVSIGTKWSTIHNATYYKGSYIFKF